MWAVTCVGNYCALLFGQSSHGPIASISAPNDPSTQPAESQVFKDHSCSICRAAASDYGSNFFGSPMASQSEATPDGAVAVCCTCPSSQFHAFGTSASRIIGGACWKWYEAVLTEKLYIVRCSHLRLCLLDVIPSTSGRMDRVLF